MPTTLMIDVDYGQLAVFAGALSQPFNDWTDRHVDQGFAWRPGSVSFRTLDAAGLHRVEVSCVENLAEPDAKAVRVIDVPFEVPQDGAVEIGSVVSTVPTTLPPGRLALRCEFFRSDEAGAFAKLMFAKDDTPRFAVVRADDALAVRGDLLTSAQPAQQGTVFALL